MPSPEIAMVHLPGNLDCRKVVNHHVAIFGSCRGLVITSVYVLLLLQNSVFSKQVHAQSWGKYRPNSFTLQSDGRYAGVVYQWGCVPSPLDHLHIWLSSVGPGRCTSSPGGSDAEFLLNIFFMFVSFLVLCHVCWSMLKFEFPVAPSGSTQGGASPVKS